MAAVGVSPGTLVYFEGLRVAGDGGSACEPSCWSRRRGQRSGVAGGLSGIRRLLGLRLPHTCLTAFSVNTQLDAEMHTEHEGGGGGGEVSLLYSYLTSQSVMGCYRRYSRQKKPENLCNLTVLQAFSFIKSIFSGDNDNRLYCIKEMTTYL